MTTSDPAAVPPTRFHAERIDADTGSWLVTISGEVDLASHRALSDVVDEALRAEPSRLVFDLSGIRFIDSSGLGVLIGAVNKVPLVQVRTASEIARRVIELSGLSELFGMPT